MLNLNKKLYLIAIATTLISSSYQVGHADFTVQSVTDPCDCSVYHPTINMGNAANCDFARAINGGCSDMSADEYDDIASMVPYPDYNHWSVRFDLNMVTQTLRKIRNHSPSGDPEDIYSTGILTRDKQKTTGNWVWDAALGYTWKCWQTELEYLQPKSIDYNVDPVFTNIQPNTLTSNIKSYVLFFNLYYNFWPCNYFKPYIAAGVGVAANQTNATLSSATTVISQNTKIKYSIPYQFFIGIRYRIFPRLLIDAKYRFTYLGRVHWGPLDNGHFLLKSDYEMRGFGFGLVYWFDALPFMGC